MGVMHHRKDGLVPAAGGLIALLLGAGIYRAHRRRKSSQAESSFVAAEPPADVVTSDAIDIHSDSAPPHGPKVGDWVQWESNGVVQFWHRRVDWVSDDGLFARVEGSMTGLPVAELSIAAPSAVTPAEEPVSSQVFPPVPDEAFEVDRAAEIPFREDRKAFSFRHGGLFAAGLALGAAAAAWIVLDLPWPPAQEQEQLTAKMTPSPSPEVMGAAPQQQGVCLQEPAAAATGDKDGKVPLQADASAMKAGDIAALLVSGQEAAAQGRPRDAELSFMMSCRAADRFKGPDSEEAADARYQLGRHYASLARSDDSASGARRSELLKRAELLYAESLQTYLGKHGDGHEKSRLAGEGLKGVWQTLASASASAEVSPPPAPESAQASVPTEVAGTSAGAEPAPQAVERVPVARKRARDAAPKAAAVAARPSARARSGSSRSAVSASSGRPGGVAATSASRTQQRASQQRQGRVAVEPRRVRRP